VAVSLARRSANVTRGGGQGAPALNPQLGNNILQIAERDRTCRTSVASWPRETDEEILLFRDIFCAARAHLHAISQARVMEVQAELDRVATFKGGNINSSILHGSQQRFPIKVGCCRPSCKGARGVLASVGRSPVCACVDGTWTLNCLSRTMSVWWRLVLVVCHLVSLPSSRSKAQLDRFSPSKSSR